MNFPYSLSVPVQEGKVYYVVVDGYSGDICDFRLSATPASMVKAPAVGATPDIVGPAKVCPQGIATYSIPAVKGASYYSWRIPAGAYLNGLPGPGPFVLEGAEGLSVDIQFGPTPSNNSVSVQPMNPCVAGTIRSKTVAAAPIPPTNITFFACPNNFPILLPWGDVAMSPGIYQTTLTSVAGCDSVVVARVMAAPSTTNNLGKITLCGNETFKVCGQTYSSPGSYSVTCPNFSGGCDTIKTFTIERISAVVSGVGSLNCFNGRVVLKAGQGQGTKTWKNEAGQVVGNADSLVVTIPGKYTLEVVETTGGKTCLLTKEVTVPAQDVLSLAPIAPFGLPKINCRNPQAQLIFNTNMPAVLDWPGASNFPSTTQLIYVDKPGVFSVKATTVGGCTATFTGIMEADTLKPALSATGDTVTCVKTNGTLRATSTTPNTSFSWKGVGFNFAASGATTVVAQPGLYEVRATGPNGCTSTKVLALIDNGAPRFSLLPEFLSCGNPTATLQVVSLNNLAQVNYRWTGPGGFSSNLREPEAPVVGTYNLVATNAANGCSASGTATVQFNSQFFVLPPIIHSDTLTCVRTSVTLRTFTAPTANTLLYQWTGPNGFTTTQWEPSVTAPGNYQVTVRNSTGTCSATSTVVVTQNVAPPTVQAIGGTLACKPPALTLQVNTNAANANFAWSGPAGFTANVRTPVVNQSGTYRVTVTNAATQCTAAATASVNQNPGAPFVTVNLVNLGGGQRRLNCTTTAFSATYAWTGPNGFTSGLRNPIVTDPGTYVVLVTDGLSGCQTYRSIAVPALLAIGANSRTPFAMDAWQVFPNPAGEVVHLVFTGEAKGSPVTIHLLDLTGRVVWEHSATDDTPLQFDVSNLSPGAYRLVIAGEDGIAVESVVIGR